MKNKMEVVFRDSASVEGEVCFNDRLELPTERIFKDSGQMIAPCTIARTGVMLYKAKECGSLFKDKDPNSIVRIATFPEDLFDSASLESYRSSPITLGHPEDDVNTENAKELVKGVLEGVPLADAKNERLQSTLVLNDADAIAHVKAGESDLSSGHKAVLVLNDAEIPDMTFGGWDAKKTSINNNHVAIVKRGRAGSARIADEESVVEEVEVKEEVKVLDAAEVQVLLDAAKDENENLKKDIQTLNDGLDSLKQQLADAMSEDRINALVKAKLDFVKGAIELTDGDIDITQPEVEIKRSILEAAFSKSFKDKDDAYINVRYSILQDEGIHTPVHVSEIQKEMRKMHDASSCQEQKPSPVEVARARMINRHTKGKNKE